MCKRRGHTIKYNPFTFMSAPFIDERFGLRTGLPRIVKKAYDTITSHELTLHRHQ